MKLGMQVGLGLCHMVLDGDPATPKKGHVYCGQTAGWMKMPLGAEVDLVPDHIVLDGNPAPPHPRFQK